MSKNFLIFLFSYFLLSACEAKTCEKEVGLEKGRISIPCDWRYTKESPVEDFVIYSLINNNEINTVVLYLGNHPSRILPDGKPKSVIHKEKRNYQLVAKTWVSKSNLFSGVVDIKANSSNWPQYIQFSYSNLGFSEKEKIELIVESLVIN